MLSVKEVVFLQNQTREKMKLLIMIKLLLLTQIRV